MTNILTKVRTKTLIQEVKPLFYLGKELEFIDYSETTATKHFCELKFKGENKTWLEDGNRLKEGIQRWKKLKMK